MSGYRSQPSRHYCEYCRTWVQGDRKSIRLHEQGNRHKAAVHEHHVRQRKRKVEEKSEQLFRDATLAQIEREAREAMEQQLRGEDTSADLPAASPPSDIVPPTTAVAIPTYMPGGGTAAQGVVYAHEAPASSVPPPPISTGQLPPPPPIPSAIAPEADEPPAFETEDEPSIKDTDGTYQIRGQHYMTGEHPYAQELYVPGTEIEAQRSGESGWYRAKIITVDRIQVPNTDVLVFKLNVVYRGRLREDADTVELDPSSFDIVTISPSITRFPITEEKAKEYQRRFLEESTKSTDEEPAAATETAPERAIDETTGLGVWEVVEQAPEEEGISDAEPGTKRDRGEEDVDITALDEDISKALTKYARKKEASNVNMRGTFEEYDDNPLYMYRPGLSKDMRDSYRGIALESHEDESFVLNRSSSSRPGDSRNKTAQVVSVVPSDAPMPAAPNEEKRAFSPSRSSSSATAAPVAQSSTTESVPPVHVVQVAQAIPDVVLPPRRTVRRNKIRRRELD